MIMEKLLTRYPALISCREDILKAENTLTECYRNGGKTLLCGNGGSAADCEHIAGELLKGFLSARTVTDERLSEDIRKELQASLPAIPLPSFTAALTAAQNDLNPTFAYAQLLYGLGKAGDVLIALSTSGNAENVCNAARVARAIGMRVIALTGRNGGKLCSLSDVCIIVPEQETYKIQELHLPIYHYLCAQVEAFFFG